MCNIIIAYVSIIIGAVVMAINKKFEPKNKIIRFMLKLLISAAIPTALVFGYLAGKDLGGVFIRVVLTLTETCFVWMLCFFGMSPLETYNECYELAEHEFVHSDSLYKYWKPWVGHVIVVCIIVIFLFWLTGCVMNLPSIYGNMTLALLLTLISVAIICIFCIVLSGLYSLVSDWIKWLFK